MQSNIKKILSLCMLGFLVIGNRECVESDAQFWFIINCSCRTDPSSLLLLLRSH